MQPKMVDLCGSFSMAQGDLTRAFSRRSKKEKERDERERERERERACGSTSWPSICASGGECTGRGRGGAGRHPQESRRSQRRRRERERQHTNPFFPINFQEIYITHPDPNTPIQFSRTDLR